MENIDNEIHKIENDLHPISAGKMDIPIVCIADYEDFQKLCKNHITFEEKFDQSAQFFFIEDGIAFTYMIGDEYQEEIVELDMTPITENELLEYSRIQNRGGKTTKEQVYAIIKRQLHYSPYLTKTDFETKCKAKFDKELNHACDIANNILNKKGITQYETLTSREVIMRRALETIELQEIIPYEEIDDIGKKYKEDTIVVAKNLIANENIKNISAKEMEMLVRKIYKQINPENHRGQYYIIKKDIEDMIREAQ